jgi:CheY-like chemotaxis protein
MTPSRNRGALEYFISFPPISFSPSSPQIVSHILKEIILTILVVDDNARIRSAIIKILTSPGIECIECNNGMQVLERYREIKPAWVLMDIKMPGINGFTAAQSIISEYPDARVVIVTDYDDKEFRATAKQVGAKAYILKEELIKLREVCIDEN